MSTSDRIAATIDSATTTTPDESPDSKALKWAGAIMLAGTPVGHFIGLWIILRGLFRWRDKPVEPEVPRVRSAKEVEKIVKRRAKLRQAIAEGRQLPFIVTLPDNDSDLFGQEPHLS